MRAERKVVQCLEREGFEEASEDVFLKENTDPDFARAFERCVRAEAPPDYAERMISGDLSLDSSRENANADLLGQLECMRGNFGWSIVDPIPYDDAGFVDMDLVVSRSAGDESEVLRFWQDFEVCGEGRTG